MIDTLLFVNNIYIFCPSNSKSGGPELLHQLSYSLKKIGINSYMVYYNVKTDVHLHPEFIKYGTVEKKESEIIDDEQNLIIAPESHFAFLRKYRRSKKAIWWTSVDNYTSWGEPKNRLKNYGISSFIKYPFEIFNCNNLISTVDIHFCQSHYSKMYLKHRGVDETRIYMLTDYISQEYLDSSFSIKKKKNYVAYFPNKGYEITSKLIEKYPQIEWKPIANMTTGQVKDLLQECKVYVDFGGFPGKDRVPREAALSGCCVISGKRGASFYYEDLPIQDKYKFNNPINQFPEIFSLIQEIFNDYESALNDFDDYRNTISSEKQEFEKEVAFIFGK